MLIIMSPVTILYYCMWTVKFHKEESQGGCHASFSLFPHCKLKGTQQREQNSRWTGAKSFFSYSLCYLSSQSRQQNQQTWKTMFSFSRAGIICSMPTVLFVPLSFHTVAQRLQCQCMLLTAVFWKWFCFRVLLPVGGKLSQWRLKA